MAAIEIKNATVAFDKKIALDNLSWRVERGARWFVLGSNGAGKTTLVKLILGMVWARHGGEVSVLGCRYGEDNLLLARQKIAWASPFLQDWIKTSNDALTVEQVALTGLYATIDLYKKPDVVDRERAASALAALDGLSLRDKIFAKCSSGEQVKTLIARSLITDPELLIFDETCVHLDLPSRENLLLAIDSLAYRQPQLTMLMITHRLEEITDTFTNGLMMSEGKIFAQGGRDEIINTDNLRRAFGLNLSLITGAHGRQWAVVK